MAFDPIAELGRLPKDSLFLPGSSGRDVKLLKRALAVHGGGHPSGATSTGSSPAATTWA